MGGVGHGGGPVLLMVSRQPYFNLTRVELAGDLQRNNLPTVRANVVSRLAGASSRLTCRKPERFSSRCHGFAKAIVRRVWPK